jgi:hypothetical protein
MLVRRRDNSDAQASNEASYEQHICSFVTFTAEEAHK